MASLICFIGSMVLFYAAIHFQSTGDIGQEILAATIAIAFLIVSVGNSIQDAIEKQKRGDPQ